MWGIVGRGSTALAAEDAVMRGGIRPAFLPRAEYFGLDRALLEVI